MSSDYYFQKWRETLKHLEELVQFDIMYQQTKAHDKTLCDAVVRLCSVLGQYLALYNDALDCLHHNLQVQKTRYMMEIVKAVTNRILELKLEIRKLEGSNYEFLSQGLISNKITTYDAELAEIPPIVERSYHVKVAISEAFKKAEEKREHLLKIGDEKEGEREEEGKPAGAVINKVIIPLADKDSEETIQRRAMVALIQTQERSRQTIRCITQQRQLRQKWVKELSGKLKPPARPELRGRAAQIIEKACRVYFEVKRQKKRERLVEDRLGIRICGIMNKDYIEKDDKERMVRNERRKQIEQEWHSACEKIREEFTKRKCEELAEDYRDLVRGWFRKWYDEITFFPDMPTEKEGGPTSIMKDDLPEPEEWWEQYLHYLEQKKANKGKSSQQQKYEKLEAKKLEMMEKKEEQMKLKQQAELMKKLMKNPTKHPGFTYPQSKKTENITEVLKQYRSDWDELDFTEALDVKEKFITDIDVENVYAEVKMDIMQSVDEDMGQELKLLRKALKTDYENKNEKLPEPMKKPPQRKAKKKKVKGTMSAGIADKLVDLAFKGVLKEYPQTKMTDFVGDHNFAGDDLLCDYKSAPPFSGEMRAAWWERCREATLGCRTVLVVGPSQSGKTVLVHALSSIIDAALFVLDPDHLHELSLSNAELQQLINSVVVCARAAQPSVIYIRNIQRLFYNKVPPEETIPNLDVMKRVITRKLFKKIQKTDMITVIGSCMDPWVAKSTQLLKQFSVVFMIPDTSYSAVVQLLKNWINENHSVPRDLDVSSLAYFLRGYSYGYLKDALNKFLSAERIVKIGAHGLTPNEIYDFILNDESTAKIEYEKYQKWYYEKTTSGKKEMKHIQEQREFKEIMDKYAEKMNKKKGSSKATTK